jgi:hypothetical protein
MPRCCGRDCDRASLPASNIMSKVHRTVVADNLARVDWAAHSRDGVRSRPLAHRVPDRDSGHYRASGSMIFGTPMRPTCWLLAFTRRSRASDWAIPASASPSTFTVMSYRGCKRMRPRALTKLFKSPKRSARKTLGSKAVANADFGIDRSKNHLMFSMAWRGGRVVECTALEMRHRCKPIGGSNPSLSAN